MILLINIQKRKTYEKTRKKITKFNINYKNEIFVFFIIMMMLIN